jgi:hypothetical protein
LIGQYTYEDRSNRLVATSLPASAWASYPHDAFGQMVAVPHLPAITWTPGGQMASAQLNAGSPPHMAYYVYDASGERTRKVVVRGTDVTERLYLGGYEVYREYSATTVLDTEEETLHVGADVGRLLLVETKTWESGVEVTTPDPKWRYLSAGEFVSMHLWQEGPRSR